MLLEREVRGRVVAVVSTVWIDLMEIVRERVT